MTDSTSLLPASVDVTFPAVRGGKPSATPAVKNVTLSSLALAEYPGLAGFAGKKFLHASALAVFAAATSTTADNDAELLALATRAAADWYRWAAGRLDLALTGFPGWTPTGLEDVMDLSHAGMCTRVSRGPFGEQDAELFYYGSGGEGSGGPGGGGVGGGGTTTPGWVTVAYRTDCEQGLALRYLLTQTLGFGASGPRTTVVETFDSLQGCCDCDATGAGSGSGSGVQCAGCPQPLPATLCLTPRYTGGSQGPAPYCGIGPRDAGAPEDGLDGPTVVGTYDANAGTNYPGKVTGAAWVFHFAQSSTAPPFCQYLWFWQCDAGGTFTLRFWCATTLDADPAVLANWSLVGTDTKVAVECSPLIWYSHQVYGFTSYSGDSLCAFVTNPNETARQTNFLITPCASTLVSGGGSPSGSPCCSGIAPPATLYLHTNGNPLVGGNVLTMTFTSNHWYLGPGDVWTTGVFDPACGGVSTPLELALYCLGGGANVWTIAVFCSGVFVGSISATTVTSCSPFDVSFVANPVNLFNGTACAGCSPNFNWEVKST